jgi:hypothetical protein
MTTSRQWIPFWRYNSKMDCFYPKIHIKYYCVSYFHWKDHDTIAISRSGGFNDLWPEFSCCRNVNILNISYVILASILSPVSCNKNSRVYVCVCERERERESPRLSLSMYVILHVAIANITILTVKSTMTVFAIRTVRRIHKITTRSYIVRQKSSEKLISLKFIVWYFIKKLKV